MASQRQFIKFAFIALGVILTATLAIAIFEHVSLAEGLYRTIYIALAHHDAFGMEDWPGRIIIILLIIASLVVIAYLLKTLADYMINLGDGLRRNKMKAKLVNMKDHYIVCGLGRVGSHIAKELTNEGVKFVGLDRDEALVKEAVAKGYIAFVGDSTKEDVLRKAKIDKARGIVAALGDDSSNLFVTLTARQLNPALYIVSRANHEENVQRIEKAGADKVAMPNQIGGFHMATMLIRPNVVDFIDVLSTRSNDDLQVEEMIVVKGSRLVGAKLGQFMHASGSGSTVLALNSSDGTSKVNPAGHEILYAGDKLIVMGTANQLDALGRHI
ncbi:NAD-binding protein [Candidatus Saccharibacteria bacterium]|nr:NAD-binding protein [Candidatus Saccharibacteria bacterium]